MQSEDGRIGLKNGFEVFFRRFGAGERTPLLILHGGPGAGHDYLEPLARLGEERQVVFYDQLGCGQSDHPDTPELWTIDYFVGEIDEVRQAFGLEKVHLLGQSWGGWLGIEYLVRQPSGIASVVLASTSASLRQFSEETIRLKAELPADVQEVLTRHEAAGDFHNPEYEEAAYVFYRKHVCRLPEWPECIERTLVNLENTAVYEIMNGPNEFTHTGNLRDWDRTEQLHRITQPTLITVGRYDELTPQCAQTLESGIPNSRLVIFEESSHTAHLEQEEEYLSVVGKFLRESDEID